MPVRLLALAVLTTSVWTTASSLTSVARDAATAIAEEAAPFVDLSEASSTHAQDAEHVHDGCHGKRGHGHHTRGHGARGDFKHSPSAGHGPASTPPGHRKGAKSKKGAKGRKAKKGAKGRTGARRRSGAHRRGGNRNR